MNELAGRGGVLQVKSYLILEAVVIININAAEAIPKRHGALYT